MTGEKMVLCVYISHIQVQDAGSQWHLVALKTGGKHKSTMEDMIIKMKLGSL